MTRHPCLVSLAGLLWSGAGSVRVIYYARGTHLSIRSHHSCLARAHPPTPRIALVHPGGYDIDSPKDFADRIYSMLAGKAGTAQKVEAEVV